MSRAIRSLLPTHFTERNSPAGSAIARRFALGLCLAPAIAAGCQSVAWKQTLIHTEHPVAIYLDREVKEGQVVPQGYSHPAEIPPDRLRGLLGDLRYRDARLFRKDQVVPVFNEKALEAMLEPLSAGLRRANPDERVRFLVSSTEWTFFATRAKGTSGVVFLSAPDQLNVAFDLIDEPLPDDNGNPRAMWFPSDPTLIVGKTPDIQVPPGAALRPGDAPGQLHPRWLVVNPAQLAAVPRAATPAQPAPATAPPPVAGSGAAPQPAAAAAKPEWAVDKEAEVIRRKLDVLDQLLRAGTITPEEHEKSRREILLQSER